jgi:deoxyribonucleoside regulator
MRAGSAEHEYAMVRAAELYYKDGLLQSEVADRLRVSRWKVGRLLEEARARGLVEIKIHHPTSRRGDLESQLVDRFGCAEAVVVQSQDTSAATMALVAQASASYLTEMRPQPRSIGFSWGRTVAAIASALPDRAFIGADLLQLNGGAPSVDGTVDAASILRLVAAKSRQARTRLLPVPAIVSDRELARRLCCDHAIADTLKLAARCDVAVFSLGALSPGSVLVRSGALSDEEQLELQRSGAVGDVLGHYIDRSGRVVDLELDSRTIALALDQIGGIGHAIAVGVGNEKSEVTYAALYAGLCSVLITESAIAENVLGMSQT